MKLELLRPLSFFDLETTGIETRTAEIVEIGIVKLMPSGEREEYHTLIKPSIPIPEAASAVHHITDEMVAYAPTLAEIADEIVSFLEGSDIGGYNSNNYDVPLLSRLLFELGIMWPQPEDKLIDVCNIFKRKETRTLKDAYRFYKREELEDAHAATVDVNATIDVFLVQLEMYKDLPKDVDGLALYSNFDKKPAIDRDGKFDYNSDGDIIFAFGQHIGKKCTTQLGYIEWMLKGDFSPEVKRVCQAIKDGKYNTISKQ